MARWRPQVEGHHYPSAGFRCVPEASATVEDVSIS